jgi:hypothetical protein
MIDISMASAQHYGDGHKPWYFTALLHNVNKSLALMFFAKRIVIARAGGWER